MVEWNRGIVLNSSTWATEQGTTSTYDKWRATDIGASGNQGIPDCFGIEESKAAKWDGTFDIANALSQTLQQQSAGQFAVTWRAVPYTWNRLSQGWKGSPTICHGLIQNVLKQGEAPEHLQYITTPSCDTIQQQQQLFRKGGQ